MQGFFELAVEELLSLMDSVLGDRHLSEKYLPIIGTIFLPANCSTYGIWDAMTKTCTLNRDITQSAEITENKAWSDELGAKIDGAIKDFFANRAN